MRPTARKTFARTTLALLLAGSAAAASAQSSVTIYGRVDQGLRYDSDPTAARHQLATGSFNGLGFRGVEDLGGGNAAFFHMEHRFDAGTGAAAVPFWDEISIVGLRGAWGELRLGRQGGPFGVAPDPDAFGGDTVGGRGERKAGADDKYNNGIVYWTPDFNGFSAAAGIAPHENAPGLRNGASAVLRYAAGPVLAAVSYARRANRDHAWALGGGYDFGVARIVLAAAHNDGRASGIDRTTVDIGAIVPLGSGSLRTKVNSDKTNGSAVRNFGLGYWWDLSKRTTLYTDYGMEKRPGLARINRFDMGVRHSF